MPPNPRIRDSQACREMATVIVRAWYDIACVEVSKETGSETPMTWEEWGKMSKDDYTGPEDAIRVWLIILSDLHAPGPVGVAVRAMWAKHISDVDAARFGGCERWGEHAPYYWELQYDPAALERAVEEALGESAPRRKSP